MGSKRGKKERMKLGQIFFILNLQTAIPDAALHALYEKRAPPMKEIPAFLSQKCEEEKKVELLLLVGVADEREKDRNARLKAHT